MSDLLLQNSVPAAKAQHHNNSDCTSTDARLFAEVMHTQDRHEQMHVFFSQFSQVQN